MADIIYTVNQDSPENIIGFEQYSQQDRSLVDSFQINSTFNPNRDYSELHILSLSDELLESTYDYRGYKQSPAAQSAGQEGTSAITIDPIEDSKTYGYGEGGVKLLYHFLTDLYSQDSSKINFYIQDISADRTEVSLSTLILSSEEVLTLTSTIKTKLQNQPYFEGFRLNFQENDLFIAINIDTLDSPTGTIVVVKLYEPLPDTYEIKSTLNIVEIVSDSVAYEVETEIITPEITAPTLRSANFNIDIVDDSIIPTNYYNYDELLSYPVNNSNSQIYSTVNEKSIDISIDHSDFSNFVHFSSAQERLLNFKYKLDLITTYSASLAERSTATVGLQGISGSNKYYEGLITGIVSNFDHYERFLYYESGSNSWPKVNNTKPYINQQSYIPGTLTPNSVVSTWYSNKITNAISYDNTNYNSLAYSIPTYLRDDANNENYLTFIYMVGQHFDNLWLYSKAVTDKYDADNRLDKGISKDLVAEALKNFGVKLYTSNKSIEDLFSTFIGQAYQSGSEDINFYITGSLTGSNTPIQPSSVDNYQKEVYKRIYHNLPLLLKSKGTERGLRALINCFGIPSDIFDIKLYGGRNINERPFYGDYIYSTSSLDKVRLDNTGSIVTGSALSQYTSIVKREYKYTDDLHSIELGFSPTDNVDKYITRTVTTTPLSSVTIGTQIWSNTNLDVTTYRNGDPIPQVTDNTTWANLTTGAWCYYNNDPTNNTTYGKMYNWYAVNDPRGLAPEGWHIPTNAEWTTLSTFLGGDAIAGGKMKSTGTSLWQSPNTSATNSSGFAGRPGGFRSSFSGGTFADQYFTSHFWSSNAVDSTSAYFYTLYWNAAYINPSFNYKKAGCSVRLVQGETTSSLIPTTFNIDDYIGDPRNLYQDNYYTFSPTGSITDSLELLTDRIMSGSSAYDVQDFVRLIKFFDNTIFKMVKDFIPARSTAATGIIIKPHVLGRSKAKSVKLSGSRPEYTASIDTAFIEGGNGGTFKTVNVNSRDGEWNTSYIERIQTPFGIGTSSYHGHQEASFDGEFINSSIRVTRGELNSANFFKIPIFFTNTFDVNRWLNSEGLCILTPYTTYTNVQGGIYYSSSNNTFYLDSGSWNSSALFAGLSQVSMQYQITSSNIPTGSYTFPFNTSNYANYSIHPLTASNTGVQGGCTSSINIQVAVCDIDQTSLFRSNVKNTDYYDVTSWFVTGSQNPSSNVMLTITENTGTVVYSGLLSGATNVLFGGSPTSTFTLVVKDTQIPLTCTYNFPVTAGLCSVISSSLFSPRTNTWSPGSYLGATSAPIFNPPTVNNYGLARFFVGENPDVLRYRVRVYNALEGTLLTIVMNPPTPIGLGSPVVGSQTFYPWFDYNMFKAEWRYGVTPSTGITGNVALFKISYTPEYLSNFSYQTADAPNIYASEINIEITALEIEPDCTPRIIIGPTIPPDDDGDNDTCCFIGSTLITLPDYTQVRIDSLKKGDEVLSYNENTGEILVSRVVRVMSPTKKDIVKTTLSNGTELEAARNHPFWVVEKGWSSYAPDLTMRDHNLEVAQLLEGDMLLTQEEVEVEVLTMYLDKDREYEKIYNIQLDNHYTYYANSILVHNKADDDPTRNYCSDADDPYNPNRG